MSMRKCNIENLRESWTRRLITCKLDQRVNNSCDSRFKINQAPIGFNLSDFLNHTTMKTTLRDIYHNWKGPRMILLPFCSLIFFVLCIALFLVLDPFWSLAFLLLPFFAPFFSCSLFLLPFALAPFFAPFLKINLFRFSYFFFLLCELTGQRNVA